MSRHRLRVLHAYLRLPHAVPVIVVIATTAAFAVLAADGMPPTGKLAYLLLAMLGAQITIGTVNELADAELDKRVKPSKPIPAGLVSVRGARLIVGVSLLVMLWFSSQLGWASLALCAIGTGVGVAYSLWFKRSMFAWLPYLAALPLLPVWVITSLAGFDARLLMLYPLGTFAVVGVHFSQSLPDVEADRASGVHNLTSALGERSAFVLSLVAIALSSVIASVAAVTWAERPAVLLGAVGVVALILLTDVGLYLRRPRAGVMACFPCVAVATSLLGLAWVLALQN